MDACLFPAEAVEEVSKVNALDYEAIAGVQAQDEPYEEPEQIQTGDAAAPNELYPIGEMSEPETDLDVLFQTPLLRAAYCQQLQSVEALLAAGAARDYLSPMGQTAMLLAIAGCCEPEDAAAIMKLVASPANVNGLGPGALQEDGDEEGMSRPLLQVAMLEFEDAGVMAKVLIQAGAEVPEELLSEDAAEWVPASVLQELP